MDKTLLDFGFFEIKWYSFLLFLSMLTGCTLVYKEAKKKNINEEQMIDLIFYSLLFGIIGARLYYVVFNIPYYLSNPLEIIMIWKGGLAIHGGLIAALVFLAIYTKKKKLNLLLLLDIIVVGLIIAQAIGRWGNFFNGEAYGQITSLKYLQNLHLPKFIIDNMYIDGYYREPTFLYESFFSFLGFISLVCVRKLKKLKTGQLTSMYLMWYGLERFVVEKFRSDSLMLGNLKVAQLVSLFGIAFGICLFIKCMRSKSFYKKEEF